VPPVDDLVLLRLCLVFVVFLKVIARHTRALVALALLGAFGLALLGAFGLAVQRRLVGGAKKNSSSSTVIPLLQAEGGLLTAMRRRLWLLLSLLAAWPLHLLLVFRAGLSAKAATDEGLARTAPGEGTAVSSARSFRPRAGEDPSPGRRLFRRPCGG